MSESTPVLCSRCKVNERLHYNRSYCRDCQNAMQRKWWSNSYQPSPAQARPLADRFSDKVTKSEGCWEWVGYCRAGYGRISIGNHVFRSAHRVSWELHNGPIPNDLFVLHKCDNTKCVRPDHLFLGTKGDNNRDRHLKGRSGSHVGELNGRRKITERDVIEIRRLFTPWKVRYSDLAQRFGVSTSTINSIINRRTWNHL